MKSDRISESDALVCLCGHADRSLFKSGGTPLLLSMKLIDKYLLREHLVPEFYCFTTFSLIYVVCDLFDHFSSFIEAKTPAWLMVRYYFCQLIPTLEYLMPASLLFSTLYALWRLARHNELTAMRAGGISFARVMLPFMLTALTLTFCTALAKEALAPGASLWAEEFESNRFKETESKAHLDHPYYNSADRRHWVIDEFYITKPHRLIGVKITQEREDGSRSGRIFAEKAEWLDGHWWLYNARIQEYDADDNPQGDEKPLVPGSDTVVEMPFLTETPGDFANEIKAWEFLSTMEMLTYLRKHPNLSGAEVARKTCDFHSRLAIPWACVVVTLFGIPAGAAGGRRNVLTGIFCALGLFLSFYALIQIGMFLGKRQLVWPWLGAWLPNMFFFVIGLGMVFRMR